METVLLSVLFFTAALTVLSTIVITGATIALFIVKVPFAPTPQRNVSKIFELLDLKPGEVFYDLGCGDGRFIIEADKRGAKAVGFEVSPWAYLKTCLNIWLNKSQAKVYFKNFYHANLSDADAIFNFLVVGVMPKVQEKLAAELKSGSRIVCYGFNLPSWPNQKVVKTNSKNKKSSKIYYYTKP